MATVDLTAFEKAVVECQPVVNAMADQIESIKLAITYLHAGIITPAADEMYKTCDSMVTAMTEVLHEIKKVLDNIDKEHHITERRMGASSLR